ncbi:GAF domain-containing protein [Peribacillus sp. SCS-155]|uniref:GAF domain-containing protein n=1 Tax=Peribacillus sedimenti TaxID=3115297 RepID=UPI0039060D6F
MNVERQLYSLINSTRVLTSTRNLDLVLQRLMEEVLHVIEAADAAVLFLYDSRINGLVPKSSIGFDDRYMQSIILKDNEGMTGKTFHTRKATIFSRVEDTSKGMANLSSRNQDLYSKALGALTYPISTMCTPLISGNKCIGVLTIDSFSTDVNFSQQDLYLLETFANQAIIAIDNATLFSQNERANKIHTELSKVSLSQRGLQEITYTLSILIKKKVSIINDFFDLLSSSCDETDSLAASLKQKNNDLLKQAIERTHFTQKYLVLNGKPYEVFFFPISSVSGNIGLLTIFVEEDILDPLDIFAVEQAIILFALEMVAEERFVSNRLKYEGFLLERIMEEKFEVIANQSQIYFSDKDRYVFVKLEMLHSMSSFEEINASRQSFVRLLYRELNEFEYKALVLDNNLDFNMLFIIKNQLPVQQIIHKIHSFFLTIIQKVMELYQTRLLIGIGRVLDNLYHINNSVYDSIKCLEYIKLKGDKHYICSRDDLGGHSLLLNIAPLELHNFVEDILGGLIRYDENNGTELLPTLIAFFDNGQKMKETAEACFVHLNTIKYRMQTIKKILETESISGEYGFQLMLAVYIHKFLSI